jgi:hypothetical protein
VTKHISSFLSSFNRFSAFSTVLKQSQAFKRFKTVKNALTRFVTLGNALQRLITLCHGLLNTFWRSVTKRFKAFLSVSLKTLNGRNGEKLFKTMRNASKRLKTL